MKYGNRTISCLIRLLSVGMCGLATFGSVMLGVFSNPGLEIRLLLLAVLAVWWIGTLCLHQMLATGELTSEGVSVRVLFRRRFYPWSSIQQAGVLWCQGRGGTYNEIVLLKPGGSPRRYRDRWFEVRNFFKIIHIPCNSATKQYVIAHYGPLDFDLSDGRPEQSIVVD